MEVKVIDARRQSGLIESRDLIITVSELVPLFPRHHFFLIVAAQCIERPPMHDVKSSAIGCIGTHHVKEIQSDAKY